MTKPKKEGQNQQKPKKNYLHPSPRNSVTPISSEIMSQSPKNDVKKIDAEIFKVNLEELNKIDKFKLPKIQKNGKTFLLENRNEIPSGTQKTGKKFNIFQNIDMNELSLKHEGHPQQSSNSDSTRDSISSVIDDSENGRKTFQDQNIFAKWKQHNFDVKNKTGQICEKINRNPEDSITRNNETRTKKEIFEVVERILPKINFTSTTRGFFKLPDRICKKDGYSTCLTLMKREGETDEPLERIGYPPCVCDELNYSQDIMYKKMTEKNKVYEALENYKDLLNQIEEHYPEFDQLEIKGVPIAHQKPNRQESLQSNDVEQTFVPCSSTESELSSQCEPSLSLIVAGKVLTYTGCKTNMENETVIEARVMFECYQREKIVSYLEMENNGTAAVYYSWEPTTRKQIFGIPLRNVGVQTFYFDQSDGVLVPGEKVNFPFTFKSVKDGIFQEKWLLKTIPKLNGGSKICIILHGVAVQNNTYQKIQISQQKFEYEKRRDKHMEAIIDDILKNVKPTPRPVTPVEETWDDQIKFEKVNENYFFNDEAILKLNSLYNACNESPEGTEWNYSLEELHDLILNSSIKTDKQSLFSQFHNCLNKTKKPAKFSSNFLRINIMHIYLLSVVAGMSSTQRRISANSKFIKRLYEEKATPKIEIQKPGKKRNSQTYQREEQTYKETNNCRVYFADQTKEMLYKTTYDSLVKAFDMIEQIYQFV